MTHEQAQPLAASDIRSVWNGPIIDTDVHVAASIEALSPYLSEHWREFMRERGFQGMGGVPGIRRIYPPGPASVRRDWVPNNGVPAASNIGLLREHILDDLQVDCAIANCYFGIDSIRHPDFAAALASAVNDWLIEEWLSKEPRLRASLVLPSRHPAAMIQEIERVGGHPGFVQVLMPVRADRLYGNRVWHPLLHAMADRGLVCGLHFGGTSDTAPTPTGVPNHYYTEYVGEPALFWSHVTSMIAEGVFQEVPSLRVSVLEAGFTWLPSLSWRLTKEWKGLRRDIPWVNEPPTELIRRHFRFSTAPIDSSDAEELASTIKFIKSPELLMFATDYPHWHDDDLRLLLAAMSPDEQGKLMSENARAWYGLDQP